MYKNKFYFITFFKTYITKQYGINKLNIKLIEN